MTVQALAETAAQAPNPQFRRANWTDLCGQWGFAHDDTDAGVGVAYDKRGTPYWVMDYVNGE